MGCMQWRLTTAFMATLLWVFPAVAQVLKPLAADRDVFWREMPLNLTPFTWREMNFAARLGDLAAKPYGYAERQIDRLPPRPLAALKGSEFLAKTESLSKAEREEAILAELRLGNIPSFLRIFKPVRLAARLTDGRQQEAIVWVMPDYLAIGSDDDFIRIPMSLPVALRFASEMALVLPTRKLVDAIYEQADVQLEPHPLPYGPPMETNAFYARSQDIIERELKLTPSSRRALIAGHKKDLVIALPLWRTKGRLLIYGWHRQDSNPIQPLSNAHLKTYADYSHGVRLVARQVLLDGQPRDFAEAVAQESALSYVPIPWFADCFRLPPWRS